MSEFILILVFFSAVNELAPTRSDPTTAVFSSREACLNAIDAAKGEFQAPWKAGGDRRGFFISAVCVPRNSP